MRASIGCLFAVLMLLPGVARAEETDHSPALSPKAAPKNIVLADLGLHVIAVGFQRTLSPHVALSVSAGLYDPWTVTDKVGDLRGGVLRLRPYFFLSDEAPRGAWISPFIQGGAVRGDRDGATKVGATAALGASIGYAALFWDVLHVSLGLGGQIHTAKLSGGDAPPSFYTAGIHVDGTIGYAF